MSGRTLVLGVVAILLVSAAWTLATRGAKKENAARFKPWFPDHG